MAEADVRLSPVLLPAVGGTVAGISLTWKSLGPPHRVLEFSLSSSDLERPRVTEPCGILKEKGAFANEGTTPVTKEKREEQRG